MENKFKMPTKSTLKSRISTINNAFVISMTPWDNPTEDEIEEMYKQLKIKPGQCAYCLRDATTADHINNLVRGGEPSGYITEKNNLVPCCTSCNSSKNKKSFEEWYTDPKIQENLKNKAGLTIQQIQERKQIIENYIKNNQPIHLDYKTILGEENYKKYQEMNNEINRKLKEYQTYCDSFKEEIEKYYKEKYKKHLR